MPWTVTLIGRSASVQVEGTEPPDAQIRVVDKLLLQMKLLKDFDDIQWEAPILEQHEKHIMAKYSSKEALVLASKWLYSSRPQCRPSKYHEPFMKFVRLFIEARHQRLPFLRAYREASVKLLVDEFMLKKDMYQVDVSSKFISIFLTAWALDAEHIDLLDNEVWCLR